MIFTVSSPRTFLFKTYLSYDQQDGELAGISQYSLHSEAFLQFPRSSIGYFGEAETDWAFKRLKTAAKINAKNILLNDFISVYQKDFGKFYQLMLCFVQTGFHMCQKD